ncbi:hypothetical protein GLAREA_13102 [Glarea lozoyensis ATCC 20868]|uniref:Uncharacterized protein n=1 Tax=Glarea lozoyensis (strain ATCC 20868 / MF5171) TaxID=1116229 RepID=S3CYM6_GLAL2|nr:uncharacterized protein GLAREA_13102 [Glarea lozoyensis ATCC 20868]EPE30054.1 hypothetical protein GLAREA_13102 [Glarea lozoyensis ATCC 20868]
MRDNIRNAGTEKVSQQLSLRDLMLNYGLDILFLLMSVVLPLDVFGRTTAEVVGTVFFRDDVSTPAPGTTD